MATGAEAGTAGASHIPAIRMTTIVVYLSLEYVSKFKKSVLVVTTELILTVKRGAGTLAAIPMRTATRNRDSA